MQRGGGDKNPYSGFNMDSCRKLGWGGVGYGKGGLCRLQRHSGSKHALVVDTDDKKKSNALVVLR